MPHYKVNARLELQAVNKDEARAKADYELNKQAYDYEVTSVHEGDAAPVDEFVDKQNEANQHLNAYGSTEDLDDA